MRYFRLLRRRRDRARSALLLLRGLEALCTAEREIYTLIASDGLTYAEVAERLGLTTDEVEQGLARALANLVTTSDPIR